MVKTTFCFQAFDCESKNSPSKIRWESCIAFVEASDFCHWFTAMGFLKPHLAQHDLAEGMPVSISKQVFQCRGGNLDVTVFDGGLECHQLEM